MKITADTTVTDAIKQSKAVAKLLDTYNLHCHGCKGSGECTIAKVAVNNGMSIDSLLQEIEDAQ